MLHEIKYNLPLESINYSDGAFKLSSFAFDECKKYHAEVIGAFILWAKHAQKAYKLDDEQNSLLIDSCLNLTDRRFNGRYARTAWNIYLIGLEYIGDEVWTDVLQSANVLYHSLTTEI